MAVAELLRLAAADRGAVLVLDDLHEADEASLRLIHYLARCATTERIALLIGYRPTPLTDAFEQFRASLTTRAGAVVHELAPLAPPQAEQLARRHQPNATADTVARIVELADGSPFAVVELARRAGTAPSWEQSADSVALAALSPKTRDILQRVAVLGHDLRHRRVRLARRPARRRRLRPPRRRPRRRRHRAHRHPLPVPAQLGP